MVMVLSFQIDTERRFMHHLKDKCNLPQMESEYGR